MKFEEFRRIETVRYDNGGSSDFYCNGDIALIVDRAIFNYDRKTGIFPYSLITNKQNEYMKRYRKVYRLLEDDLDNLDMLFDENEPMNPIGVGDRGDYPDTSPLEFYFEKCFLNVYGSDSLKYLQKEYSIIDPSGRTFFLDYLVCTEDGDIAVEENGVSYHHPQLIGENKYRKQLHKQNLCNFYNIKLYRFSTEDCQFSDRMEDDIRSFFGKDASTFIEKGITVQRNFQLYEHQEITLENIRQKRKQGIHTFLAVFPTASGKSKIVEEDIRYYIKTHKNARILIIGPNRNIIDDWKRRTKSSLASTYNQIDIRTFAYMVRHYTEHGPNEYSYIVVDEAHHVVAPALKRMIQYFNPDFLIGLTATDQRPDKKKLESVFGGYTTTLSLKQAMEKHIVAQANVYRIETNIDLRSVRFNGKEYINTDLEKKIRVTSRNELIADVLSEYFCQGQLKEKQGVIFCVNTQHAHEMEKVLLQKGISAKAYTSKTNNIDQVMKDFCEKKIRFLCACQMISEGWDYPELGILVMARPTLSKVMYLQQIGRGLRRTKTKDHVYVIDVVDEYGAMVKPCSMHSIFSNAMYVPFGNILRHDYSINDIIEIDGLHETIERIIPVDIETFEDKYGGYFNSEQLAREFFLNTGTVNSWIKKGRIVPDASFPFGKRVVYLFSPQNVKKIREENNIPIHNEETIYNDFFNFLEQRDYSLSYKMPFLLAFFKHMDSIGDAKIDDVLEDYISFYKDRIKKGLPVDRKGCPYDENTLGDRKFIKRNMLTNPFEKFERKRFMYYSKDLGIISLNHDLVRRLGENDIKRIELQMQEDLKEYYKKI